MIYKYIHDRLVWFKEKFNPKQKALNSEIRQKDYIKNKKRDDKINAVLLNPCGSFYGINNTKGGGISNGKKE